MSRSKKKLPYLSYEIFKKNYDKQSITFYNRNSLIPASLINKKIFIYNGKRFSKILITKNHVGFRLGEFSFTRKTTTHKKKSN